MIAKNLIAFVLGLPGAFALLLIRGYQIVLSPLQTVFFGPGAGCRFHPSCSEYGVESIRRHGLLLGGARTLWRVLKCHPFHPGGFDPVLPRHACRRAEPADDASDPAENPSREGHGKFLKECRNG